MAHSNFTILRPSSLDEKPERFVCQLCGTKKGEICNKLINEIAEKSKLYCDICGAFEGKECDAVTHKLFEERTKLKNCNICGVLKHLPCIKEKHDKWYAELWSPNYVDASQAWNNYVIRPETDNLVEDTDLKEKRRC
ncbi:Hypothetical predicted protein [Paramuricea clavata]|uniref:Uncharacterized protein n=1 Tax=Paramuricea clavata TaxID=317549 RepID=A0A7D9HM73_PARCT|nr:Hypothetical predicted protein [Paramuricea clavata]